MSIDGIIFAGTYILIAIVQLFVAVAIIIGQKNWKSRFMLAGFLISLSINNFMIPLLQGDGIRFGSVWLTIRFVLMMVNIFYLPLFALTVLRPIVLKYKWLVGLIIAFMVLPIAAMILDSVGLSQRILGTLLVGGLPTIIDPASSLEIINFASGPIGTFYKAAYKIAIPAIALFGFTVSYLDKKRNPTNSRAALILGATLVPFTLLNFQFADQFAVFGFSLFQIIFTIGLAFSVLSQGQVDLFLDNLQAYFANWPMLSKLIVSVTGLVLPGVILLSLMSVIFLQTTITKLVGEDLYALAQAEQKNIQSTIAQEVQSLTNLSNQIQIQALISSRLSRYQGLSNPEIFEQIQQNNHDWLLAEDNDSLVNEIMSIARNVYFQEYMKFTPLHTSMVLVDKHGGLIAATALEPVYNQTRTLWWKQVMNTNQPSIMLAHDRTSETNEMFIEIAIPVQNDDNPNDIEGVLMSRYSLSKIASEVYDIDVGENGGFFLFTEGHIWIHPDLDVTTELQEPNLDWDTLMQDPAQFWQTIDFSNTETMAAWAPFEQDLERTGNLSWVVVAYKPESEALEPISGVRWTILLIGGVILIGTIIVTAILANLIVVRLLALTETAEKMLEGDRNITADVGGTDEIGVLATSFNAVTSELNRFVNKLEDTVSERTAEMEKRALQLETSALVAQEAASIRNLEALLTRVSDLITERFGFYHTGIFLIDATNEYAVLRAANSPGGKRMLARGHKLQIGKVGVVGYAAGVGEPRVAQDVGADVVYYDNPDMPDTLSELALPLKVRDEVIGVMDVQSTRANAFALEDVQILELLGDQIALAIDNTRLLESSQRALSELQYLYGQSAADAWRHRLENNAIEVQYDPTGFNIAENQTTQDSPTGKVLIQNIVFRGQVIGAIELERQDATDDWTVEEQTLVAEIIEQAALALENARLVDQIRLRSNQIQLLQEVTALSAGLLNEKDLLNQVTAKIQRDMGLLYVNIWTIDAVHQTGYFAASAKSESAAPLDELLNQTIDLKNNEVILEVIQTRQHLVVYDLENNVQANKIEHYKNYENAHALVIVPLIARGEVIGVIDLSTAEEERVFEADELTLLEQISTQVASALNSTRLFSQTTQRAERERLVADITNKVRASNDPETIIQTAVQELQKALGVQHAEVVMGNGNNKNVLDDNGQTKEENTINQGTSD